MTKNFDEEYSIKVKNIVGTEYTILGKYVNSSTGILTRHNICGRDWEISPNRFLNKAQRCPFCLNDSRKKSNSKFSREIEEINKGEYILKSIYTTNVDLVTIFHSVCKREFSIIPRNFLSRKRCPLCSKDITGKWRVKSTDFFIKELFNVYGEEFSVVGEYYGANLPILVKHNICGNKWSPTPHSLLTGSGCPKCSSSRGERAISKILDENSIEYFSEYRFKECRDIRPLPFDFYLPEKNICIEYDGIYHYELNLQRYSKKEAKIKFQAYKKRDEIKNNFCSDNGILLIRIPYWELKNIKRIMEEALNDS